MNFLTKIACSVTLLTFTAGAMAEIKVIGHSDISDRDVPVDVISDIYLNVATTLPSGIKVTPVDQADSQAVKNEFYSKTAKKDSAQMRAYWSRLIFTGKGRPPRVVNDNEEVIAAVKSRPGFIGYVSGNVDTSGVKVLLVLP